VKILYPYSFFLIGVILVMMFHFDTYLPIWLSVCIFTGVSIFIISSLKSARVGILTPILWLVFAFPFIHIIPYMWFDFENGVRPDFWKLFINPYTLKSPIIELAAMIGAVGGVGFAFGVSMHRRVILLPDRKYVISNINQRRSLMLPIFMLWTVAGFLLSWFSAPETTIFNTAYSNSSSSIGNANFSSAWMLSYSILTFVFCDALLDESIIRKRLKLIIVLSVLAYVMIVLQLLRGDRESVPFFLGLFLVYYFWDARFTKSRKSQLPWLKVLMVALFVFVASMIIGGIRESLTNVDSLTQLYDEIAISYKGDVIGFSTLFHGTWSAVFLTPMSIAGDHIYGLLDQKWGETYLDLALSIPPGFVADWFDYTRPINGFAGPAWEMRYGIGGTHASVVPFMNFRMTGVFLITALWAFVFCRVEKKAVENPRVSSISLICIVVMASPHWLWYGEKSIMNAIIMWLLLKFFYSISLTINWVSRPIISASLRTGLR